MSPAAFQLEEADEQPTLDVLPASYRLKVIWIYTIVDTAQVIQLQPLGYRADHLGKAEAVGLEGLTAHLEVTVAKRV